MRNTQGRNIAAWKEYCLYFEQYVASVHKDADHAIFRSTLKSYTDMANSNGVFSDLFNAVGAPVQNAADTVGTGVGSALSLVESCTNLCASLLTSSVNTALQLVQGVTNGISSAIAPKK
jgi:chlorosome envelope protein F